MTLKNHPVRAVAFLISQDGKVTAKNMFEKLEKNAERMLRQRFDSWRDGQPPKSHRYHGWDRSEYKGKYTQCFVFKCKERNLMHRFYGFLCNPIPLKPRFQVCVLVTHDYKDESKTNPKNLERVEEIRTTLAVQKAVSETFKERL